MKTLHLITLATATFFFTGCSGDIAPTENNQTHTENSSSFSKRDENEYEYEYDPLSDCNKCGASLGGSGVQCDCGGHSYCDEA